MDYLPCVEKEPSGEATAAVIWLHGLGADGNDFAPIISSLGLPSEHKIRFVFPHAPSIPVTINNGFVMPAWYDILEMSIERSVDVPQLNASAQQIAALIDREVERGVAAERILIAGFSQGGAVAYQCALTYPKALAGVMALSTYFATAEVIEIHEANANIPVHIYHGLQDPVVPEILGQTAKKLLQHMGYKPTYTTYNMEHSVSPTQIADMAKIFKQLA